MHNGRFLSQLCTSTERYECLRLGLELRWGFFLSFSLSDTPHYENVPFEVPESWVWTTLEEICLFLSRGKSPKYSDTDKTYPVFAQKCNLKEGGISLEQARFLDPSTICKWSEEYKLKTGDVLLNSTGTGTVGRTRLFHESYLKNYLFVVPDSHVSVIRTTSEVKSEFVFAYISSQLIQQYLEDNLAGSTNQKELYIGVLSDLSFPLPPLTEQQRIVVEIKKWFELIDQIEQGKTDLQAVIKQTKSKILDLAIHGKLVPQDLNDEPASELLKRINPDFTPCDNGQYGKIPQGWFLAKLGDLFDAVSAKRVLKSEWRTKGVPFYRAREIVKLSEYNKVNNELFIEDKHYDELKKRYGVPASGDIMLSAVGTIGKSYIVKESDKFYYKDASVLCLRNHNKLSSMFFSMLFSSSFIEDQIKEYSKGTTVDTITLEKLKSYIVPLPPLNEQQRIVQKIEELFLVLDNIQKALEV